MKYLKKKTGQKEGAGSLSHSLLLDLYARLRFLHSLSLLGTEQAEEDVGGNQDDNATSCTSP
eukprot:scaffold212003_cov18-Tisochrysis_lutea.AAC.1